MVDLLIYLLIFRVAYWYFLRLQTPQLPHVGSADDIQKMQEIKHGAISQIPTCLSSLAFFLAVL